MATHLAESAQDLSLQKNASSSHQNFAFKSVDLLKRENLKLKQNSSICVTDSDGTYSKLHKEVEQLKRKLQNKQCQLDEAYCEISHLKHQFSDQSRFCTILGAVFSTLMWSASLEPKTITHWITRVQTELESFLSIVNGTFVSFVNAQKETSSLIDDDAHKFITGLLGTIANLSASPDGAQFLISQFNGHDLVLKLIKHLPDVTSSAQNNLKRQMLLILYNVSKTNDGVNLLRESKMYKVLAHLFNGDTTIELRKISIRLLHSLMRESNAEKFMFGVRRYINFDRVENLHLKDPQIATIIGEIKQKIRNLANRSN